METNKINENPLLSIKSDLIVLIAAAISLFILNWQININIEIIAGIILVITTGYGLINLLFPKKNDINFSSRLILSPILGIFLIGFWSIILNYTPYNGSNIYYELAIIPILLLLFIIRTIRFLKSKEYISSVSSKMDSHESSEREEKYNNLNTAQAAAKAEKEKLRKINKKIGTTESISGYVSPSNRDKNSNNSSRSVSSMPQPPRFGKHKNQANNEKVDDKYSKKESKTRWAFKSQKNTKSGKSNKELEIIKIRKSTKDIILILILTIVSGIFIFLPLNSTAIKIPFTLLLLFFVSGYCMLSGIFISFSDNGLLKKIISSVLLSIAIILGLASLLNFIKIHIPSTYVFVGIIILSLSMGILGYLRKTRHHKKAKQSFKFEKKYPISEKSEFNVLTVSQSKDSASDLKDNEPEKNIFKKYSIKNTNEKPLQKRNSSKGQAYDINEIKIKVNNSDNIKDKKPNLKEKIPSTNQDKNSNHENMQGNISEKSILTPSDARKIVMSRKKEMEKRDQDQNKSSRAYNKLKKDEKKDSKKTLKPISSVSRNLSPLKLITVIILSIMGLIFTIIYIPSFLSSVKLVFIVPILIYLPGYAIKKLFMPDKFSRIIFTTIISIIISLSLDILVLFVLLYLGHLFNQSSLNQSLYIGILAIISILCILMAFWKSNKRSPTSTSINELSKKDSEKDKAVVENKAKSDKNNDNQLLKNKKVQSHKKPGDIEKDRGIQILKADIALAEKEAKKQPVFTINKKSEPKTVEKPVPKNYLEEDLAKSFSSSDVFENKKDDNQIKKPDYSNQNKKKRFIPLDLLIILIITFLTILSIYVPILSKTPLNSILGLLFVLFIPGYTLIAALFPKKQDLDNIERLALSFGMSLAISPLIGLALNYTPFGIKLTPIVISLTIFTIIMSLVSYIRRRKVSRENRFNPYITSYLSSLRQSFNSESRLDKILSIILILSLVLAIATTAFIIVKPKEGEKFTEFYILGPNGKASDYPTNLTLGQPGKLLVGVVNHEYSTVNYKVVVKLQGKNISTENISLKNNQKWEKAIIFTPDTSGTNQKLELLLYKLPDDNKDYRSLHLWVNVV